MTGISPDFPDFTNAPRRLTVRTSDERNTPVANHAQVSFDLTPDTVDDTVLVSVSPITSWSVLVGANIAVGVPDPNPRELLSIAGTPTLLVPAQHRGAGFTITQRNLSGGNTSADTLVTSYGGLAADLLVQTDVVRAVTDPAIGAGSDLGPVHVPQAGLYERACVVATGTEDFTVTLRRAWSVFDTDWKIVVADDVHDGFTAGDVATIDVPIGAPGLDVFATNAGGGDAEMVLSVAVYRPVGS